jgi:hypothetical protein
MTQQMVLLQFMFDKVYYSSMDELFKKYKDYVDSVVFLGCDIV